MTLLRVLFVVCLLLNGTLAVADDESSYRRALSLIEAGNYDSALAQLKRFEKEFTRSVYLATARMHIALLQNSVDAGEALPAFFTALALKDQNRVDEAIIEFAGIAQTYPYSSLTDDALYMAAYLQVMIRYDFIAAKDTLDILLERYAHTNYIDSALYLKAIALEQIGDTHSAQQALIELRERHTVLSLPLDFRWPAGDLVSRYWFDRADRRLAIVEERMAAASIVKHQDTRADGILRLSVSVKDEELVLLLEPSPLTDTTRWLDASLAPQPPPPIGIYDGVVKGRQGSWARIVLHEGSITGVVNINGEQQRLSPANLVGTLDYYQPESRQQTVYEGEYSELARQLQIMDTLVPPPAADVLPDASEPRQRSDIRTVPLSIVIDSQFDRYYAGAGLVNALNSLNVADGIYREFGLALKLDASVRFDRDNDPLNLGSVALESILRSFREFTIKEKSEFKGSVLSYLFTGNPKTDVTLGLAWIDTLCRRDGYDVGVTTPSGFGDVLLTHELGHSFGAQHDSDTQCSDNQDGIMWPNISERTGTAFSSCSQSHVQSARAKSCLNNVVDLKLAAYSRPASVEFIVTNPDSQLSVDVQIDVETSLPDQTQWPEFCGLRTPTGARCLLVDVGPGENRVLALKVHEQFHHLNAPIAAKAEPIGIAELQPANNTASTSHLESTASSSLVSSTVAETDSLPASGESAKLPETGAANARGSITPVTVIFFMMLLVVRVSRIHLVHSSQALRTAIDSLLLQLRSLSG